LIFLIIAFYCNYFYKPPYLKIKMEIGNTFYFKGSEESPLVGHYIVARTTKDLLILDKLDAPLKENPDYTGRLLHGCDECGNFARAKPLTGKGLIGILIKSPFCAGFPERYILNIRNSSIKKN